MCVTVGTSNAEGIDQLTLTTGLTRSRLYDIALQKFLRWARGVDPYQLRLISLHEEEQFGYVRRPSGFVQAQQAAQQGEYDAPPPVQSPYPPPQQAAPYRNHTQVQQPRGPAQTRKTGSKK